MSYRSRAHEVELLLPFISFSFDSAMAFTFSYIIWSSAAARFGDTCWLNYLVVIDLKHSHISLQEY